MEKIRNFFGGSVVRWFGGSDSIRNNSTLRAPHFLWKGGIKNLDLIFLGFVNG